MRDNTYNVRVENVNGIDRYFAFFADGEGVMHETEVSFEVYLALESCRKHEKRQDNFDDRHVEQAALSEGQLQERMIHLSPALELLVENQEQAEQLQSAISALPEIQRRRFLLYHEDELTYRQIAALEFCSKVAVIHSIQRAEEKIKSFLKNRVTFLL